ncbi:phosphoenolpyruvate synthase [Formosa agariphila KMM 3901]|uniref:Phosphoenolpyruvate synthase n=1 Tax=Formosa agariphila (strain DSM 15362 / KCTC 12365 / LMG 23005 / KMM 3901 / M-2Alg 35-1) TaxID=1347342 RepID=T2KPX2_FORAG|nr:PEP/pyruvate-binding domain-containing protein [Formosa agariphila]CDF80872.1 phosphoenolpyruvate synthase [Formosa agariphila KMM 3901]
MNKLFVSFACFLITCAVYAQDKSAIDNSRIKEYISDFKKDIRGPYRDIRWFCDDGTINMPKEPCEDGGVQHARYKDNVIALGEKSHVYLGQILASTAKADFWDQTNAQSRLKQYIVEKYLKSVDDGWIHRRSQYYRGAIQVEDEQAWGKDFFSWLLKNDDYIAKQFYLIRQAVKDIPHSEDTNVAQLMRSQSKVLAEEFEPFMNLRIKIHGQPEPSDIEKVKEFKASQASKLTPGLNKQLDELVDTMSDYFEPVHIESLSAYVSALTNTEIKTKLNEFITVYQAETTATKIEGSAEIMWFIRQNILEEKSAEGRLALFDLSLKLELLITKQVSDYPADTLEDLIGKVCYLSTASAASGYTELWEWQEINGYLAETENSELTLETLHSILEAARKQLEWGTGKNSAVFGDVVTLYEGFEPLVHGFLDDRIRGSVALPLGNSIGKLGTFISAESALSNRVLNLDNQSHIHGLNPGYAKGKLVVVEGSGEGMDVDPNNIYVFDRPPSDLKPIAGILTVSEGNLVSHVQLLARNLGIPNAAISSDNIREFKKYSGEVVFYAVSNKGTVIMKQESEMTADEQFLFSKTEQTHDMITVPVEKIRLDRTTILNLREVNAKSSGIYCGPKAANLGELKENFPDHVVEGFVIPFGIFLNHMKQTIPNETTTYWDYLNSIFNDARQMEKDGKPAKDIENFQLTELSKLRKLIIEMPLLDGFISDLEGNFQSVLGTELGETSVFLRSDTNMEDLKSFTGAGLNLTLFNVLERNKIIEGIKTVWASPYTERSFKWRQKYLTNPENVYPSIVVIPGVNNDFSGVMITKGVSSGNTDEITVAFSRGVGGAVDGQAAETWTIKNNGNHHLISPSREPSYLSLPSTGGTKRNRTTFETPIVNSKTIATVNAFSKELVEKMEKKGIEGPYDVELGFKEDKLWLFQVRPFVENKKAKSSTYLESITPKVDLSKKISNSTAL